MSNNQSRSTLVNFIWRFAERCGAQLVSFVVSIVLARLLAPEVYGTIALVLVITNVLNVFVDSGLGTALIQKKDADDLDFSTVFFFNIVLCSCLYLLLFLTAPWFATFYGDMALTPVIRVLGLTIVISGVKNIQIAYVSKQMIFKKFFFATLGGTIGAAVIGIMMAYMGFGVWALVAQQIFNNAVDTIILWLTVPWRPKRMFSWKRMKALFGYGWKLLASGLIDVVYGNMWQLIIGKVYSVTDLAYFNRGDKFPNLIAVNINTSIDSVLLPMMSQEQNARERVKAMTQRAIKTSVYVMAPLMVGLSVIAEPLVLLMLTEKWLPSVFFLRICSLAYIVYPIHTANLNAIKALGRSDLFLKLEIVKKIIGLSFLLVSIPYGVKAMACSMLLSSFLSTLVNAYPNKKLLKYGWIEQILDVAPYIMMSLVMGAIVYSMRFFSFPIMLKICMEILCGIAIYILFSAMLKIDIYEYLLMNVKRIFINHIKKTKH